MSDLDLNESDNDLNNTGPLFQEYLSDINLMEQIQSEDLTSVKYLELLVNLSDHSLSTLGEKFPNLIHLKLNSSVIPTIRDLGTSLRNLQVIWLNRCGLKELDGIHALPNLKELYLAYNDIDDISSIGALEHLQVLDLEGNRIDDIGQLMFLQDLESLETLSLANNECVLEIGDSYYEQVLEYLPQLKYLDDEPIDSLQSKRPATPSKLEKDEIEMLKNTIKYTRIDEDESLLMTPRVIIATEKFITGKEKEKLLQSRPSSAVPFLEKRTSTPTFLASSFQNRPHSARPKNKPSRPLTAFGRRQSTPFNSGTVLSKKPTTSASVEDSSSELTYGSKQVFAGNIVKNLRNRKAKQQYETPVVTTTTTIDIYDFNGDMLEEIMAYKLEEAKKQIIIDEEHNNVETQFITDNFQPIDTSQIPLVEDDEYFPSAPKSPPSVDSRRRRSIRSSRNEKSSKVSAIESETCLQAHETHNITPQTESIDEKEARRRVRMQQDTPTKRIKSDDGNEQKIRRPRPRYLQKSTSPSENIPPNHRELSKDHTASPEKEHPLIQSKRLSESRKQLRSIFAEKEKMREQLKKSNTKPLGSVL